jgi:hypothetical protein
MGTALAACVTLVVAVLALLEFRRALKTGATGVEVWFIAARSRRPCLFWFCTVCQAVVGVLCLLLTVLEAERLLP